MFSIIVSGGQDHAFLQHPAASPFRLNAAINPPNVATTMPKDPEPTWMERFADRRPPYFWWLLAFILASCFAILSWSLCIAIFGEPENPRHYKILDQLGRLPTHKAYTSQTAPSHPALPAPTLRKSFLAFSDDELAVVNRSLLHNYLTDFQSPTFCCYISGSYKVLACRPLNASDLISQGLAVQLRAYLQPDAYNKIAPYPVIVELIVPTNTQGQSNSFKPGDAVELDITPQFASLLHVAKIEQKDDDTVVVLSAVSLAEKIRPPHGETLSLTPPERLNITAEMPFFDGPLPPINPQPTDSKP